MIKITNMYLHFNDFVLIKDAKFEARKGTLTMLIGESGIGKTTLLDVIGFKSSH